MSSSGANTSPLYTPISGATPVKYTTAHQTRVVDSINQLGAVVNQFAQTQAGFNARFSGFEAALASQEAVALGNYSSLEEKLTRLTDHFLPAQGPTDMAGVRAALADDSAIRASLDTFGPEWLYTVRGLIPMEIDSFKAENGLVTAYPWPEFKAWCIATFNLHDMEKQALTKLMTLRQTASVAEYKAAHDVLAAKSKLPTAQRLIYWEQGLKPEIRAECKLDPLTHTAYANLAAAQTAALAVDSHFSSVASGKKRSVPTAATATVSSSKKPKTDHEQSPTVAWSINGTKFHCARNGVMQLPVPQFFTEWISSLPKVNGKSHLPREHFASGVSMPTCFAKGCGQTHAWTRCPTLAHTIWDSRSTQPATFKATLLG
ncbi:TPA: hypothetical protein ACH3X2_001866 [Trebouxia sp. C0005]